MSPRVVACATSVAAAGLIVGCASPFDVAGPIRGPLVPPGATAEPSSVFRSDTEADDAAPALGPDASPDDYLRYALFHSPQVEAEYQRWRAAAERLPQVSALPDPRLNVGLFLDEVETRVGPQHARVGMSQTFPWPGTLQNREDAAAWAALAAWRRFEGTRLAVTERVVQTLHELAYLDAAIRIAQENLDLLRSFEEVVRARYRVGAGTHPELVRVQVELGQVEDRLAQLRALRPAFVAELNAALNRPAGAEVGTIAPLPGRVATVQPDDLIEMARRANPVLLALDDQVEEQRVMAELARKQGLPDLTVGLDYTFTGEAINRALPESGDDPIMLSFGVNVPLWREKYAAAVREALARRLAVSHERADEANRIGAAIQRSWFDHTDADRRVRLFERTLIPKAEESLRATLAAFRAGDASFLDLIDAERTLLAFAVSAERARADRGRALALLHTLVGQAIPTQPADNPPSLDQPPEVRP